MGTLHWKMREILPQMQEEGRLNVLIAMLLRCNIRMRCYPALETLVDDTGLSIATVNRGKNWLIECGFVVLVPYKKRIDDELKLSRRHNVYQLTGVCTVSGKEYQYLYLTDVAMEELQNRVRDTLTSKVLTSKVLKSKTLAGKDKGIPSSKGVSKGKGKKEIPQPNGNGKPHFTETEMNAMKEAIRAAFQWDAPNGNEWGQIQRAAYDLLASPISIDDVLPLFQHCKETFTIVKPTTLAGNVSEWRKEAKKNMPVTVEPEPDDTSDYITIPDNFYQGILK